MKTTPQKVLARALQKAVQTKSTVYVYRSSTGRFTVHKDPILAGQRPRLEVNPTGRIEAVRFNPDTFKWAERRLPVLERKVRLIGAPQRGQRLIR